MRCRQGEEHAGWLPGPACYQWTTHWQCSIVVWCASVKTTVGILASMLSCHLAVHTFRVLWYIGSTTCRCDIDAFIVLSGVDHVYI